MNLDSLFKWTGELVIKDLKGKPVEYKNKPVILYQRVVGDADVAIARKRALSASRKLRRNLKGEDEMNRDAMLPDYESMTDVELRTGIMISESMRLRQQASESVTRPKRPVALKQDATLEEQEEYDEALTNYDKEVDKVISTATKKFMKARAKELEDNSRQELLDTFLKATIDAVCRVEMLRIFNDWCAYLGTYSTKSFSKKAFGNYDLFDNAASELKEQIIRGYTILELNGGDLKK